MKKNKQDLIYILIIVLLVVLYVLVTTNFFTFSYGSSTDWDVQHWSIPDYFRKQFYATGEIFSNFAPNIGNGQNIYYLSYYGYLSPIVLFSYLLPFIPMKIYIEGISIIGLLSSAILFYLWMKKKYDSKLSFVVTLLFISASPLLFHSHRHIMYTCYMPFLILALKEIDNKYIKHREDKINCKLIFYLFLIIMSNYFFAVSALFSITLYEFHNIFFYNKDKRITEKIKKQIINYIIEVLVAVLMSMVLLLPTFYVILSGRSKANIDINFIRLFIPEFNIRSFMYGSYNTGLIVLTLFALIRNIKSSKYNVLSILLLISIFLPFVSFMLNGTMYTDYKVLIPLIPLIIYNTAHFIKIVDDKKHLYNNRKAYIALLILTIITILLNIFELFVILFILETIILVIIFKQDKKQKYLIYYAIFASIVSMAINTRTDTLELNEKPHQEEIEIEDIKDKYNYRFTTNSRILQNTNNIKTIDYNIGSIYSSTSNPNYKNYYYNFGIEVNQRSLGKITPARNKLFNIVNGNKYIYNNRLIINEDALSIARSNMTKMSLKEFEKLEFPYNMEALYKYIVVDEDIEDVFKTDINEYKGKVIVKNGSKNKKIKDSYHIKLEQDKEFTINLENINKDDLLIIEFDINDIECPLEDRSISINRIKNTITCKEWKYYNNNNRFHYVVDNYSRRNNLRVHLTKGEYYLSNIKVYILDYNKVKENIKDIKKIDLSIDRKNNNKMYGEYDSDKDDIVYLQIPYDKGFNIKVNGVKKDYYLINDGMIGFNINIGHSNIEIDFEAPLLKESKIISLIGLFSWIGIIIYNSFNDKKGKKR